MKAESWYITTHRKAKPSEEQGENSQKLMRIGIMMRDIEYRDALIDTVTRLDKDIFIEIAGAGGAERDSVILTDVTPEEIEPASLDKLSPRTVFLLPMPVRDEEKSAGRRGLHTVFKYSSVSAIMSELASVYAEWSGDVGTISASSRVIAVTGESDQLSSERCRALARQIIYRHGGTLIIIPLGYINDYGTDERGEGAFRRLMYLIDEGRDYPAESYTQTDSYGISSLLLPGGISPLPELGLEYLARLTESIGMHYDTVILDIGTCYSRDNTEIIRRADSVLFFGSGRRTGGMAVIAGDAAAGRTSVIDRADPAEEALAIDDYVRSLALRGSDDA